MRKRWSLFLLVVCLLLVSGIAGCPEGGLTITERGVRLQFIDSEPPLDKIYEGEEFMVGVELLNEMTYPMNVWVSLKDTLSDYQGGIEGKDYSDKITVPAGETIDEGFIEGYTTYTFPKERGRSYKYNNIPHGSTLYTNFIVELRAGYGITLTPTICVKKKGKEIKSIDCPDTEILYESDIPGSSRTPIAVTSLKKDLTGGSGEENKVSVRLTITFENVGGGEIFGEGKTKIIDFRGVKVYPNKNPFKCMTGGLESDIINLRRDKAVITCTSTFDLEDEDDFFKPILRIDYAYGYKVTKSTSQVPVVSLKPRQYGIEGGETPVIKGFKEEEDSVRWAYDQEEELFHIEDIIMEDLDFPEPELDLSIWEEEEEPFVHKEPKIADLGYWCDDHEIVCGEDLVCENNLCVHKLIE